MSEKQYYVDEDTRMVFNKSKLEYYGCRNNSEANKVSAKLNEFWDNKIEICNYIQRKLNECNNKEINRFVNSAFSIEEGSGYFKALIGIKKGLIKKGLWEITIEEDEDSKIDTKGWIKKDE